MKKGILMILTMILVLSSSLFAYAEIDDSDVNYFLEKLATSPDEAKRETGAWLLETYMDSDEPDLRGLKLFIRNTAATQEDIDKLESQGYTLDEAIDSLDILGEMSREDIQAVISAIKEPNLDDMKEVIDSYYEDDTSEEPIDGGLAGGGGTSVDLPQQPQTGAPIEDLRVVKFKDVNTHWAMDNITFLAQRGIINGYSDSEFGPNNNISRAEFTTLIVKLLGLEGLSENELEFEDIKLDDWFYNYIKIAKENGVISGIEEKQFKPQDHITREQMVHVVMNALAKVDKVPEIDMVTASQLIDTFEDKDDISNWAKENFTKAIGLGIIKGRNEGQLAPKENLTRAEAATIIRSVFDLTNK